MRQGRRGYFGGSHCDLYRLSMDIGYKGMLLQFGGGFRWRHLKWVKRIMTDNNSVPLIRQ